LFLFFCFILIFKSLWAEQKTFTEPISNQFGGHLKLEENITGYDAQSYFEPVGTDTGLDGAASIRLTDKLAFSDTFYIEAHYEAAVKSGDTYKKRATLEKNFPLLPGLMSRVSDMDNRRLFDLTKTIKETGNTLLWHRLDRFFFSAKPAWGDIMVGRQAITWGNGLIFNPMDLFNPFSPADIVRDYKMGDDLVSVRLNTKALEEITLLYVPRRNVTGNVDFDASSIAGKLHFFAGDMEVDLMGSMHYDETVFGLGATGYLGDTAWRCDIIWSSLDDTPGKIGYFQVVANIDYSWIWFNKNMYGLIEYYHNGLGQDNYTDAFENLALMERIDRGELFAFGKNYINTQIQVELHPLLNLYFNTINNIKDPSGILQPRLSYSMTQNSTLLLGANIFYGSRDSEYGGFLIPGTPYYTNAAANGYLLFTYYF
jgi:hypothetical protein